MASGMLLIWIGSLLIIGGVLYGVAQVLWKGRLSDAKQVRPTGAGVTLEPQERLKAFSLAAHWPALCFIAIGTLLILTRAAF